MLKPLFYRVDQVMILLNLSRASIFRLLSEGKLIGHNDKPGRTGLRITVKSVDEYVEQFQLSQEHFQDQNISIPSTKRKIISRGID